jgi:sec-independent protein translocase protein TatC
MSLRAHLDEFRKRIVLCAGAVVIGATVGWLISAQIWAALSQPVTALPSGQSRLAAINFSTISSAFDLRIETAICVGIVLSAPVWLFQIFAFIVPGLTRRERMLSIGFVLAAFPLFLCGCAAGWMVVPRIVQLLTSFAPGGSALFLDASQYLSFVLKLMIAIGIAFVLPVFIVMANFAGIVKGRSILRAWRVSLLVICLFTAVATPAADVVSMLVLAAPLLGLYFAACAIAIGHDRRASRRLAAFEARALVPNA